MRNLRKMRWLMPALFLLFLAAQGKMVHAETFVSSVKIKVALPLDGEWFLPQFIFPEGQHCRCWYADFSYEDGERLTEPCKAGQKIVLHLGFEPDPGYTFIPSGSGANPVVKVNGQTAVTRLSVPIHEDYTALWADLTWTVPAKGGVLTLPATLREIQAESFRSVKAQTVIVPEGTRKIGSKAFSSMKNLRRVILPDSLTSIADDAFSGCHASLMIETDSAWVESWADSAGIIVYHEPAG